MLNKIFIFLFLFFVFSCGQNINSNYNDQGQYGTVTIDTSTPAGARFNSAYKVIQSKCMACHNWSGYTTSDKWIQSGYVIQGNYSGSSMIMVLKNYGGSMPKNPYAALSNPELVTLESWITNL